VAADPPVASNTHWDAEVYDRIGTPMRRWAREVIADLALRGDETVLDAGCGSGQVTLDLLERLPRGKIYAVDYSPEMIAKLTATLREKGVTNVVPIQADLTDFSLPEQVDAVFSNAVFHWIHDDDGLFGSLFRATKPGGRLRAQCGGGRIFARLMTAVREVMGRQPYAGYLADYRDGKKYRSAEEAKAALEKAGWRQVRAWTFGAPVSFDSPRDAALYLRTIILRDHVARLPEGVGDAYVRDVVAAYLARYGPPFTADYVRLNLAAVRPA